LDFGDWDFLIAIANNNFDRLHQAIRYLRVGLSRSYRIIPISDK
jgi:hypothetical protein